MKTLKMSHIKKKEKSLKQKTKPQEVMQLGSDRGETRDPVSLQTLVPVTFHDRGRGDDFPTASVGFETDKPISAHSVADTSCGPSPSRVLGFA